MGEVRQKIDGNQMKRLFAHVYKEELLLFSNNVFRNIFCPLFEQNTISLRTEKVRHLNF